MGLERRLIGVDLVEEEVIRIIAVLHHVEPETPGFFEALRIADQP
jgi:hypothetical protein